MISDDQIIDGCKKGKHHAFNMLYQKYASLLLGVCMRYSRTKTEAEDVLQEGFVKIFKRIDSFEGRGSFEGWLKRIMVNTAINQYKSSKKYQNHYDIDDHHITDHEEEDGLVEVYDEISQQKLMQMINDLPNGYRMVFNLYVFEGMSHKEIAEIMGFQVNTSKSQLSKARKMLRTMIEKVQRRKVNA